MQPFAETSALSPSTAHRTSLAVARFRQISSDIEKPPNTSAFDEASNSFISCAGACLPKGAARRHGLENCSEATLDQ